MDRAGRRRFLVVDSVPELLVWVFVALVSFAIVFAGMVEAHRRGLVWVGVDGPLVLDPMQYVAWTREVAHHVLIGNPYELDAQRHVFLHPGLLVSGALNRLGVPATFAYMLWKPVAMLALLAAAQRLVWLTLATAGQRARALLIGLVFFAPALAVADRLGLGLPDRLLLSVIGGDASPLTWYWGFPFTVLAVACEVAVVAELIAFAPTGQLRRRAAVLGALCAWLQPWQGATLLVVAAAVTAFAPSRGESRFGGRVRAAAPVLVATAAPLLYYALLARFDPDWRRAGQANAGGPLGLGLLFLALCPLLLPALAGCIRRRRTDPTSLALWTWVLAALAVYLLVGAGLGTFPYHALQGVTIPLAVLAVRALARLTVPRGVAVLASMLAVVAVLLCARAGYADALQKLTSGQVPSLLVPGERDALRFVEHAPAGGVLSTAYLGPIVPALTGKPVWFGELSWTPDFFDRGDVADRVFGAPHRLVGLVGAGPSRPLTPAARLSIVRRTGARYLVADCASPPALLGQLAPLVRRTRRFGCARVLELRTGGA